MQGTFLCNYFETGPQASEMSFKSFSIFSSVGHFVQRSGTILAILVKGHKMCNYLELCNILMENECHLKFS